MTGLAVDFGIEVRAGLDGLGREVKNLSKRLDTLKAREPFDVRLLTSASSPASGDFSLTVGGPDAGYYWHVRRVVIGGANFGSTVNGTAELYVTALTSNSGTTTGIASIRDLNDLVDEYATMPKVVFYSEHQLMVHANENLTLVVHGPSASTLYKMSAQVQVYRTVPAAEVFEA